MEEESYTAQQANEMPNGTVLVDKDGCIWLKREDAWHCSHTSLPRQEELTEEHQPYTLLPDPMGGCHQNPLAINSRAVLKSLKKFSVIMTSEGLIVERLNDTESGWYATGDSAPLVITDRMFPVTLLVASDGEVCK